MTDSAQRKRLKARALVSKTADPRGPLLAVVKGVARYALCSCGLCVAWREKVRQSEAK